MRTVAIRGDNAVIQRASAAIALDGSTLAVDERRQSSRLWVAPVDFNAFQDSANADYVPLDTCNVHQVVLCSLASTQSSHGAFTTLYKSSGIPDGNGDFTFTKVADCAEAPFSTISAGKTFSSVHALDDGSWLLSWNSGYLFRSTDQGQTWTQVIGLGGPQLWPFSWAGVDGAHIVIGAYSNTSKVWISHDYGATWTMVYDLSTSSVIDIDQAGASYNSHIHTCIWDPTTDHAAAYISRGDTNLFNGIVVKLKKSDGVETYEVDTSFLYRDAGVAITGITLTPGSPVVISIAPTGWVPVSGSIVRFYGVGGTTELNSNAAGLSKNFTAAYVSNTSFSLTGTDGANFSAWTSGGVFRLLPFGTGQLIGMAQPCGAVAKDGCIYWSSESVGGANVIKQDLATGAVSQSLNIPRFTAGAFAFDKSTLVHFEFRKIGGLYFLPCITDTTTMRTEIYVSPDLVHWASVRRVNLAGSDSFWGYQTVSGMIGGRCFVGYRTAASTFSGQWFDMPRFAVCDGFTAQGGEVNLLGPAAGHTNDNASFSTPSHDWTKATTVTTARSTEKALTGTHSLRVEYTSTTVGVNTAGVYTPNIVANLGYTPQIGDYITFRALIWVPTALRNRADFLIRAYYTFAGSASGKTTLIVPGEKRLTFLEDGWAVLTETLVITGTYSGADDVKFAILGYNIATGDVFYVGGAEIIVRKTDRLEFFKPFNAGTVADEYGLVPMTGAGLSWTATFLWRPGISEGQIDAGNLPVCRIVMADQSYVDLKWIATAGGSFAKFSLQRTLVSGGAQTAVLSATFNPKFDDVLGVAVGTDPDNDRIYAVLYTPQGTITFYDVDTGLLQPVAMLLGVPMSSTDTGVGEFNAVQVFDESFVTVSASVLEALQDLEPNIRRPNAKIGMLLPV